MSPEKFIRCVKKVKRKMALTGYKGNPYAICRVATGYHGTTHHNPGNNCINCRKNSCPFHPLHREFMKSGAMIRGNLMEKARRFHPSLKIKGI